MRAGWLIALVVVVLAAAVAFVAVRAASDDEDDLEAWAGSVCSSVSDWRTSVLSLTDVGDNLDAESLRGAVDDARAATDELISDLRDLGAPDVESGEELKDELDATVSGLRTQYEALEADAREAFDGSLTEVLQGLASLAPRFQALLDGAATLLQDLQSAPTVAEEARAELGVAFDNADACAELRAGG